jgi:hypothetical protein
VYVVPPAGRMIAPAFDRLLSLTVITKCREFSCLTVAVSISFAECFKYRNGRTGLFECLGS